jgi:hypothetical protein
MEVLTLILAVVGGLVALDVAALRWGTDSRERPATDYRR